MSKAAKAKKAPSGNSKPSKPQKKGCTFKSFLPLLFILAAAIFVPNHAANLVLRGFFKLTTARYHVVPPTNQKASAAFHAFETLMSGINGLMPPPTNVQELRKVAEGFAVLNPLDVNLQPVEVPAKRGGLLGLWLDQTSKKNTSAPVILHLHGGGYSVGSADSYIGTIAGIGTQAKANVFVSEYRLIPENSLDEAIEDVYEAYQWIVNTQKRNPKDIVLMGDSAGGGMVLFLLLELSKRKEAMPAGGILLSPAATVNWNKEEIATDFLLTEHTWKVLREKLKDVGDKLNIAHQPSSAFEGFPPIYTTVGVDEELVGGCELLHSKLLEANVNSTLEIVPDMPHVWTLLYDWFPEAQESVKKCVDFMKCHTGNQK